MPADEVTHGTDVDTSRGRTGPRHAAPKKPLFTRFQMPAGKAIALAAMPTAVFMGLGFTPTLANADDAPASNSQAAEEYKDCVAAMEDDASASATPSASPTDSTSGEDSDEATPTPSATAGDSDSGDDSASGDSSSSDSGSDDAAEPTPTPTPSAGKTTSTGSTGGDSDKATPTPSASASAPEEKSGGLLDTIGDAITGIFTGGTDSSSDTASTTSTESTETTDSAPAASPTPTASPAASPETAAKDTTDTATVKDTTPKVTEVLKDATDTAAKAAEDATKATKDTTKAAADTTKAAEDATASPSASASPTPDADDCPVATDDEGGVDNTIRLPDDPWILQASSLLLKGADYQGIVKVRTASGTVKEVLKYVISNGTEIGDLHQIVKDDLSGKTYHVEARKGDPKSTITDGKTIMYTESISGNLFGLIPVTFSPKSPPPLNIP